MINLSFIAYIAIYPVILLLRLITLLPYGMLIAMGRLIGRVIYKTSKKLRHITEVNINLCFPELTAKEKQALIKKNFEFLGIGIFETALSWWGSKRKTNALLQLSGIEHMEKAINAGRGVIMLSPHATAMELIGRMVSQRYPFVVVYRPHKKKFIAMLHQRYRYPIYTDCIARNNLKKFITILKNGGIVWYAPDIDAGKSKKAVFAPFFGIPAATLTTLSRIAKLTNAKIVPLSCVRRNDNSGYQASFAPALDNFPSKDPVYDATRINAVLEEIIKQIPAQYIWQYKRFKTRPKGEERFY